MTWRAPQALTAARLSDLCRVVLEFASVPTSTEQTTADRFVVRSGPEPPELLAKLLQEGTAEDAPEFPTYSADEEIDAAVLAPGETVVQEGYRVPGPIPADLWQSVRGGRVLLFAIERHAPDGAIVSVLWVALSDEPPTQEAPLKGVVAW
ncbi:MAG: cytochrome P450 [Gemmataceae bacterium]|nr:cytochrome P450 [Gemmataceae bacterium]